MRLFVNRAKDAGTGLWRFDGNVVDGAVNGSASSTVQSALGSSWWDRWIVDGLVRFVGGFIKNVQLARPPDPDRIYAELCAGDDSRRFDFYWLRLVGKPLGIRMRFGMDSFVSIS